VGGLTKSCSCMGFTRPSKGCPQRDFGRLGSSAQKKGEKKPGPAMRRRLRPGDKAPVPGEVDNASEGGG